MIETLAPLSSRFEGMPGMMQGGYIAAVAAGTGDLPTRVRIRRPLFVGDELTRHPSSDGGAEVFRGDELVMRSAVSEMLVEAADPLDLDVVRNAVGQPLPFDLPFATCAGCGNRPDGLGAKIRPVSGAGKMVSIWTPQPIDALADGNAPRTHVWTVIDCFTSWALFADPPSHITNAVTGHIAMQFFDELRAGEQYVMQSWRDHDTERGTVVGGTVRDLDGNLVALADQELVGTEGWGMDIPVAPLA